jgi:hypothetical protein
MLKILQVFFVAFDVNKKKKKEMEKRDHRQK